VFSQRESRPATRHPQGGIHSWRNQTGISKTKSEGKVAELDGVETTRIIWKMIQQQLMLPSLDIDLDYYGNSATALMLHEL
jgi:isocitrate dehydrogenase